MNRSNCARHSTGITRLAGPGIIAPRSVARGSAQLMNLSLLLALLAVAAVAVSANDDSIGADAPDERALDIPIQPLASEKDTASDETDKPGDLGDALPGEPKVLPEQAEQSLAEQENPLPKAENIDLDQPIDLLPEPAAKTAPVAEATSSKNSDVEDISEESNTAKKTTEPALTASDSGSESNFNADEDDDIGSAFVLLGKEVPPRTATRLAWTPSQSFEGISGSTPVLVVNGKEPGPTLCLSAAVHGDELNGIEIVRRVMYDIVPEKLSGTVVGVPIVNIQGFQRNSRYLTDRRDLNRFFPGNPKGSLASRIAASLFTEIIQKCDYLVDLHTGSFHRTNLPQIRADLHNPAVAELSRGFGSTVVLHSSGGKGTLRYAANMAGVAAVTLEAGEPMRLQDKEVAHGVKAIQTLMRTLGMQKKVRFWGKPEPVFYESTWVRADHGGILFSEVFLGKRINEGDLLGTVTDPITNKRHKVISPTQGRVLGMALNQVVMPGFAAFRIGIESSVPTADETGEAEEATDSANRESQTSMDQELDFGPQAAEEAEPETAE